ncbi:MAG: SH3 domain-containing protein [Pleurocapsa minor GSE-CHR-MK-17-07R]|jgi:hypothetical protein|nr:SH3 domain-containing protein [Pleurocapsa minor GSE-CHR-MK 17-07R]
MHKFFGILSVCLLWGGAALAQDGSSASFTVVVNSNANLRSCAGTTCDVVGQVAAGDVLEVLGTEEDWYHIRTEAGDEAYIANFLVTRGPDEILTLEEWYQDEETDCEVQISNDRGDMDMYILIAGENQDNVVVDLYRPNETRALPVAGQNLAEFIDSEGEFYIYQYYSWSIGWPLGMYNIEYAIDDVTRRLGFEVSERGEYTVRVYCSMNWESGSESNASVITMSGVISVGDSIEGEIAEGERRQYILTADSDMTVNIAITDPTGDFDSFLRVYNDRGDLIDQNDDIERGQLNSLLEGFELAAGATIIIEVGAYEDASAGSFTLSVLPAE